MSAAERAHTTPWQVLSTWRADALDADGGHGVLLHDPVADRRVRLSAEAAHVVSVFRTARTADAGHTEISRRGVELAPAAYRALLDQLARSGVLTPVAADSADTANQSESRARTRRVKRVLNPFVLRWDLGDPTPGLRALAPVFSVVDSAAGRLGLLLAVLSLPWLLWRNSETMAQYLAQSLTPWQFMAAVCVVWPVMKSLHEAAHAGVLISRGGRVNRCGVHFLFFMPVPFVDASDAWRLPRRRDRIAVSAAGVIAELAVAAVCLWLWQSVADGVFRTGLAAAVVVACTASLFVNANPLMKFDGYHILQDLLGTTNLQAESTQTLRRLAWRALGAQGPAASLDRRWRLYAVYGVAALAFKVAVLLGIALWFAVDFPLVGLALASLLLCSAGVLPLLGFARMTVRDRATLFPSAPRQLRAVVTVLAGAILVFVVPFPHYASAEGVSTVPREAQLVSTTHGELTRLVEDGTRVEAGQPVARQTAFDTQREHDRQALALARRTQEKHGLQFHPDASRRATSAQLQPGIAAAQDKLARLSARLSEQVIRAGSPGLVSFAPEGSAPGQFVGRGQVIGTVVADDALMARVMLRQETAESVLDGLRAVSVWVPGRTPRVFQASVGSVSPVAVSDGFAHAFTRNGGGEIATDAENRSVETGAAYVDMRLQLHDHAAVGALRGQRVVVRYTLAPSTVASRIVSALRHTFFSTQLNG
ncbi:MAG: hypothetical protein AAGA11_06550 [Pseudomonadota bacterium]